MNYIDKRSSPLRDYILKGRLLVLTANIESVTVVNLQAYFATKIVTTVKGFMIQAPGVGYVYVTIQYLQKIAFSKS